ncbi:MAG TPA: DUF2100 domain-containing protein [Candidatus Lokiarchaeia archaeon]
MSQKIKIENIKTLLSAIDNLIDIKTIIRKTVPTYELNEELENQFISSLKTLHNKLNPFFSKYLQINANSMATSPSASIKEKIIELANQKNLFLISANSSKKALKNVGIDPRFIIVSGGPLFSEDYTFVNPSLSENILIGIKSKCERIINQLKSEDWTKKDLVFIFEKENITDKLILKRAEQISKIIGKNVVLVGLGSWNELEK